MKFKEILGIDISKNTIDAHLYYADLHSQFENNINGFKELLKWVMKNSKAKSKELLICYEHTGIYNHKITLFLAKKKMFFAIISGLEIKRSLGIKRGKNDKIDSKVIAQYAYFRRASIKQYKLPTKTISKLQKLIVLRDRMVKQKGGYQATIKEFKACFTIAKNEVLFKSLRKIKDELNTQIVKIETEIKSLIKLDEELKEQFKLITSVKGVGLVLGVYFLVTTNGFTRFKDGRKYACYCGVAPFEKQSGTSLNARSKVSHFANKKMKALLYLAATSALQHDPEIRIYYQKRIEKGKSRLSTINIVKNKIIHRVYAVINRGTPYVELSKFAA
jgi:transposase